LGRAGERSLSGAATSLAAFFMATSLVCEIRSSLDLTLPFGEGRGEVPSGSRNIACGFLYGKSLVYEIRSSLDLTLPKPALSAAEGGRAGERSLAGAATSLAAFLMARVSFLRYVAHSTSPSPLGRAGERSLSLWCTYSFGGTDIDFI